VADELVRSGVAELVAPEPEEAPEPVAPRRGRK
jgi:hypothetical protein